MELSETFWGYLRRLDVNFNPLRKFHNCDDRFDGSMSTLCQVLGEISAFKAKKK